MINKVEKILANNYSIKVYFLIVGLISIGLYHHSGFLYFPYVILFLGSLITSYFVLKHFLWHKLTWLANKSPFHIKKTEYILSSICIVLMIGHLHHIGGFPSFRAISVLDVSELVSIRRNITAEASVFWNYMTSFNIRAILPFTLLYLIATGKNKMYWLLFFLALIYVFALMQKSYVLSLFTPVFIYALYKKKWILVVKYSLASVLVVVLLVYITNPSLKQGFFKEKKEVVHSDTLSQEKVSKQNALSNNRDAKNNNEKVVEPIDIKARTVFDGIMRRVFIIPGEMVGEWFEHIPDSKPYLGFEGYRFVAKIKNVEYQEYARDLYPIIRPAYAKRGLKGSVNTASFMYEFANFGWKGLIFSGVIMSMLFLVIESMFGDFTALKISMNTFHIFLLSSGALTSLLFSGGWLVMLFLFWAFKKNILECEK